MEKINTKTRNIKGQATIELVLIFPLMLALVFFIYYSGFGIYRQLTAYNINYSAGMTKAKNPYGEDRSVLAENLAIAGNGGVNGANVTYNVVGYPGASGGKQFRAYLVTTTVDDDAAHLSGTIGQFARTYAGSLTSPQAQMVYPVSPFLGDHE